MRTDLLVDLAAAATGGRVLQVSDEYLNPAERLLADDPVSDSLESDERGPRRDGWETRRQGGTGHDWAIVRLGIPGFIRQAVVHPGFFGGDTADGWSLEAIELHGDPGIVELVRSRASWVELVPRTPLRPNADLTAIVTPDTPATHVRLVIYPDGGIGRLRCLGDPIPPPDLAERGRLDLAAVANGARVVDASDRGPWSPNAMLADSDPDGTGWLTRRRRRPGREWAVVRLAGRGEIDRLQIDTRRFKGHAPRSIDVEGIDAPAAHPDDLRLAEWAPLLSAVEPEAGKRVEFADLPDLGPVTHVRLCLLPDGAISRFRALGTAERPWHEPA